MKKTILALATAQLIFASCPVALAQSSQFNDMQKGLDKLEQKFFEHSYNDSGDSIEDRLTRLEKMVFGEARTGDNQSRLNNLLAVVSANQDDSNATTNTSSGADNTSDTASSNSSSNSSSSYSSNNSSGSAANSSSSSSGSSDDTAYSGTDYPRVDMLEEVILGQEYKNVSLKKRLDQLETKVFGRVSQDDDLSSRTDKLEMHWQRTLAPKEQAQYDRDLTWLESQVIGQSYQNKPFIERVQTLEGIIFPNEHTDYKIPLKEQIATLVNAVHLNGQSGHPSVSSVTPMDNGQDSGTATDYYGNGSSAGSSDGSSDGGSYGGRSPQSGYTAYNQSGSNSSGSPRSYRASPLQQEYSQSGGDFSTASGYPQPSHSYPGASNYQQPAYQDNSYQQPSYQQNSSQQNLAQQDQTKQNKGHPLLKGLAKALGAAATMAVGAVSSMGYGYMPYGYGGYGYGGYGGYGMNPYMMGGMPYGGSPYGFIP